MSVATPLRHLSPRCLSYRPRTIVAVRTQTRLASSDGNNNTTGSNPILEEYLRNNPDKTMSKQELQMAVAAQQQNLLKGGDISSSSIFESQRRLEARERRQELREGRAKSDEQDNVYGSPNRQHYLDPDPRSRELWERRKVIQAVRKGGRLTRTQMIKRTEREHLVKSENMKTSVKKLGMLARQISGKTLEDAMIQMRFSQKKAAIAVRAHLDRAKNEAIVMRGMGLGTKEATDEQTETDTTQQETKGVRIRTRDGKMHTVTDPKKLYIDQAWVGRGPYGKLLDIRARGRANMMRTPFTSISVLLKEESTRVREHKEREDRQRKKRLSKLWTHLPDRPLQGPRGQYYSW